MSTATARADVGAGLGGRSGGILDRAARAAVRPVSSASSAVHRILFGLLGAFGAARFLANGWVDALYLAPDHHLTYAWFPWVRPLPGPLMYAVVVSMVVLGIAVAIGYRTRWAAAAYLAAFVYCELIDAALYLNHYWYVTLATALLVVLPVGSRWSLDTRAGRVAERTTVPAAVVWALRLQIAVVYVMAGLGKLNADWLVHGEPMRTWLASRTDLAAVGPLLDEPGVALAASWAGMLFDLTIVGFLLWRRTRLMAWIAVVVFHVVTWQLFPIGVFPWVMIAGTLVFFPPAWPLRWVGRWNRRREPAADTGSVGRSGRWLLAAFVAWGAVQLAVPLRHVAYAGDVRWTEEGYYGSFRVMLTEKTGWLRFRVTDGASGELWTVHPTDVLTGWQAQQASSRADLLLAAAHVVADMATADGHRDVEVRADSFVTFNGRRSQRMIDPGVDLAALDRRAPAAEYVLPLDPPITD